MENQLGKSIVKASIIISVAAIICMAMYVTLGRNIYVPMGDTNYLNQQTGKTYFITGKAMN
jgi:hypothetical protein